MAYYDALIAKWPSISGPDTATKLATLNALTVAGSIPASIYVTGAQILNCINWTEFAALTAQQQSNLLAMCQVPGNLLGGSSNTAFLVDGMIIAYFPLNGPTIAALTALSKTPLTPWWQWAGYQSIICLGDLVAAGLS